jgi:hypothetical protein
MPNTASKLKIYRTLRIKDILRIARERAVNPNMRTKKALSDALGITYMRLSGMEDGTSQIPMELAYEWCQVTGDRSAWQAILHIYGYTLPPTDPRLIESLSDQLTNYIEQAREGMAAAERLQEISSDRRPGVDFDERDIEEILRLAKQIRDTDQSSECVIESLEINWDLCIEDVDRQWTQQALSDHVVVPSIDELDEIKREAIGV